MNLFRGICGPLRSLRTRRLSVINNLFPSVHITSNKTQHYTTIPNNDKTQSSTTDIADSVSSNDIRTSPSKEELENEESWMVHEIQEYYRGKNMLAKMMGHDPTTFTDKDVEDSIRYLLPSSLTAKDARPFLKHPSEIFPKRKESAFDSLGRPLETGFYTGSPAYYKLIDEIYKQEKILESTDHNINNTSHTEVTADDHRTEDTPLSRVSTTPMRWLKKDKLANILAEELTNDQYDYLIQRLTSLSYHPQSYLIKDFLDKYRRPLFVYRSQAKLPEVNDKGYSYAIGRRKTAVAQVWLKQGYGRIIINKRSFLNYFPRIENRQQVLYPFMVIGQLGKWNVEAKIAGGGTTAQTGALRLGISKALLAFPGNHGNTMEQAGLLVRDPRMVERKKPGQKKARKKFTWVKR